MQDSKRDTDVKNRFLDSVGEGEGGMICKNRIETCILPYVKQIASPGSMQEPLVAQTVKTVPAMPETQVRSLCWENLLEKEMATHSRILASLE